MISMMVCDLVQQTACFKLNMQQASPSFYKNMLVNVLFIMYINLCPCLHCPLYQYINLYIIK